MHIATRSVCGNGTPSPERSALLPPKGYSLMFRFLQLWRRSGCGRRPVARGERQKSRPARQRFLQLVLEPLEQRWLLTVPANDLPSGAEVIPAAGPFPYLTAITADITDATTSGEPLPSCSSGSLTSRGIWYRFTPTTTADYVISAAADAPTATTVDDTVMAIYTSPGGAAGPFTEIPTAGFSDGCDDDSAIFEQFQSVIVTRLAASTEYWIIVWKFDTTAPTAGNTAVQLRVTTITPPPANDTGAGAIALTLDIPINGSTNGAANDYELPAGSPAFTGIGQAASTAPGRDVVYSFIAPSTGPYSFRVTRHNGSNPVLYVASSVPGGSPPTSVTTTLAASNRNLSTTNAAEEIVGLSLTAKQRVFVFLDEAAFSSSGGGVFTIEVNRTSLESEPNGTPATANALALGIEGSIAPAGDADFFSLGTPPAGSRVFALIDGAAGNSSDFDLRVTTSTDTLEYDDEGNDPLFGGFSPNVAGTPLTGAAAFLRVSPFSAAAAQAEPYRLYAVVQPAIGSAPAESEPNNTLGQANSAAANYFRGTLASSTDTDLFSFAAAAGELIFLSLDEDPLRDNTPLDATLALLDSGGSVLLSVDSGGSIVSTTSGPGNLTSTTPQSPAEGLVFRASATGIYYARVTTSSGAGDYLLSVAFVPNHAPTCTIGPAQNTTDESGQQSVSGWITNCLPNDPGQSVVKISIMVDKPELFAAGPAVDASGKLTYTPAPNVHGTAMVTVTVNDDGGTASGGSDSSTTMIAFDITKPHPFHNSSGDAGGVTNLLASDVTNTAGNGLPDGRISTADALTVISFLNQKGLNRNLPSTNSTGGILATFGGAPLAGGGFAPFIDVRGTTSDLPDNFLSPADALAIIGHLNAHQTGGEGESAGLDSVAVAFDGQSDDSLAAAAGVQPAAANPLPINDLLTRLASDTAAQQARRRRASQQ